MDGREQIEGVQIQTEDSIRGVFTHLLRSHDFFFFAFNVVLGSFEADRLGSEKGRSRPTGGGSHPRLAGG